MTAAPIDNVINAILNGQVDDDLDAITGAIADRKKIKARSLFHTVKVGATATLKNLRPQYMIGVPVVITKKNQTRIECRITDEYLAAAHGRAGRFDARPFTVTPDMLELTDA